MDFVLFFIKTLFEMFYWTHQQFITEIVELNLTWFWSNSILSLFTIISFDHHWWRESAFIFAFSIKESIQHKTHQFPSVNFFLKSWFCEMSNPFLFCSFFLFFAERDVRWCFETASIHWWGYHRAKNSRKTRLLPSTSINMYFKTCMEEPSDDRLGLWDGSRAVLTSFIHSRSN